MPHLAQLNVAVLRHPLDHPDLQPFVDALEPVNASGDTAPGFVWRLVEDDHGDATGLRPWGDDLIVNLTVWKSVEALREFVYSGQHLDLLRARRSFFVPMDTPSLVLWWVPDGHRPDLREARERLEHLTVHGPSPHAFTLRDPFPAEMKVAHTK